MDAVTDDPVLGGLLAAVTAGFQGDADAAAEAFADDASFRDNRDQDTVVGRDGILGFFLAFGGRRERFLIHDVLREGDRAVIAYTLSFQADAHSYAQEGTAWLRIEDGLLTSWDGLWIEREAR